LVKVGGVKMKNGKRSGILECWNNGILGKKHNGMMEWWNTGIMRKERNGIMEYWNNGIMEKKPIEVNETLNSGITGKIFKTVFQPSNLPLFHYSIIPVLFLLGFISGCSMFGGGPGMMGRSFEGGRKDASFISSKMEKLWSEKTISLQPVFEGGGSGNFLMGGSGERRGGMVGSFPLYASATLVDSVLMNVGIEEFSSISKMNDSEKTVYRTKYTDTNQPGQYLFVWLELRTSYSGDLLKLDNWSIFLEDDRGGQYDPKNTIEYKGKEIQIPENNSPNHEPGKNNYWQMTSKVLQLYFPKNRYDGSPLINKDIKSIKLVMFNWKNNARFEGTWYINPKDNNTLISDKP
jgi:hypothetical protein